MLNAPATTEEWMVVARERGEDAKAILPTRASSIGPVYMVGYAIECAIKAYLQHHGIARPTSGREGHNLKGLWKQASFMFADLRDHDGRKAFFIEQWSTDFRYQTNLPQNNPSSADLVKAAQELVGWILAQIKRTPRRVR